MNVRNMARWCALTAVAALLAAAGPAASAGAAASAASAMLAGSAEGPAAGSAAGAAAGSAAGAAGAAAGSAAGAAGASAGAAKHTKAASRLPACRGGSASTHAPTTPAGPGSPGACRASGRILESAVQLTRPEETAFTPSGYHHLGANSAGEWSGVSGRISVVDGSIRPGSYDFVAGRFMVKRNMGGGQISWLEAGWAQTGWAGPLRQHIYTFNTNTHTWQFYDQYALQPGDRVWLDLHSDADGVWGAWLWWNNRWNLLTAQRLPIGQTAYVEQYVEVHVDAGRPARIDVPEVTVDNVQLRPPDGGNARYWRDDVPTLTGYAPDQPQQTGGFCLNWVNRYDTWTAGDCGPDADAASRAAAQPTVAPAAPASAQPTSEPATPTEPATPSEQPLLGGLLGQ